MKFAPQCIYANTGQIIISNSNVQTSLLHSTSFTLPANYLSSGANIRYTAGGTWSTKAEPIGQVLVFVTFDCTNNDSPTIANPFPANTSGTWILEDYMSITTRTGVTYGSTFLNFSYGSGAAGSALQKHALSTPFVASTGSSIIISPGISFATASSSNEFKVYYSAIELLQVNQ